MEQIIYFGVLTLIALVVLGVISLVLARLYKRASKEVAYVRTGMGGQKVVKDGGAIIIPVMHDTLEVNMQTLKLEVHRGAQDALITKDRIRVDVVATFYTKVKADADAIATAAQTLGARTQNPQLLKEVIEDKFVDALRGVAATMTMSELHEKRSEFTLNVQNAIEHDLVKNGLELENVSITKLDQTDVKYLNENNVFDAEGLANIRRVTEQKRKERNEVEQENRVAIEQRNLEANQKSLTIKQQNEFATLDQEREVETRRAEQEAQLVKQRADRQREANIAQIEADQATALARTASEQATILAATQAKQKQKEAEIAASQQLRLAEQVAQIAINEKSEAESQAKAKADLARAEAVEAAQAVTTAEAVATAERSKQVAIIEAEKNAGQKATEIKVQAQAEFDAAELQAKARTIAATALQKENEVKAEGERKLAEAANSLSDKQVAMRIRLETLKVLPSVVAEMAKPMNAVKNARVVAITGLNGNGAVAGNGASNSGNVPKQLTDSLLDFRLQAPIVDELAKAAGIDLRNGLQGINIINDDMVDDTDDNSPLEVASKEVDSDATSVKAGGRNLSKRELRHLAGIRDE